MAETIPSPPSYPIIGHVGTGVYNPLETAKSRRELREKYGPIYSLNFFGRQINFCSSHSLVDELCDECGFHKAVEGGPLEQVRNGVGDGLFTAYHGEENWGIAHRVLGPGFGPAQIQGMFPAMLDINAQLLLKWQRLGPDHAVTPTEDFTRLAFDTIAMCLMHHRFNSYYYEDMPPFCQAMTRFLLESGARTQRPSLVQSLMHKENAQYESDIKLMADTCDNLVANRKSHPTDTKDLLTVMLESNDPKTGRRMTDASIRNNLITMLIAGHETTSGMLSFTLYHLCCNPLVYTKLQAEIDHVLGHEALQLSHISKLDYTQAILRESLRLNPPAGVITVAPFEDTLLGGKYELKKGTVCALDIAGLHRDPAVWGSDAEEFHPERMLPDKFEALPANAWKPFGNGARGCIGRPLAWQESVMMLATLFQHFDIKLADPSYQLHVKQTLTVKPDGFKIYVVPRRDAPPIVGAGVVG